MILLSLDALSFMCEFPTFTSYSSLPCFQLLEVLPNTLLTFKAPQRYQPRQVHHPHPPSTDTASDRPDIPYPSLFSPFHFHPTRIRPICIPSPARYRLLGLFRVFHSAVALVGVEAACCVVVEGVMEVGFSGVGRGGGNRGRKGRES